MNFSQEARHFSNIILMNLTHTHDKGKKAANYSCLSCSEATRTRVGSMNQQGNEIHWGLIKREEMYHVVVKVLWWCNMYRKWNFPSI